METPSARRGRPFRVDERSHAGTLGGTVGLLGDEDADQTDDGRGHVQERCARPPDRADERSGEQRGESAERSAVIATSIGLVFRSTIAGVGATLGFIYIVPVIINLVPLDVFALFSDTFPGNASTNFFTVTADPGRLDPLAGLVATVTWTAAWVVFSGFWVKRRNT